MDIEQQEKMLRKKQEEREELELGGNKLDISREDKENRRLLQELLGD